jgi:hypothetical protein
MTHENKNVHARKKVKKHSCFNYSCDVKNISLKCKFCNEHFCNEHLKAKLPRTPHFNARTPLERLANQQWAENGGHACTEYYDNLKRQEELTGIIDEYARGIKRSSHTNNESINLSVEHINFESHSKKSNSSVYKPFKKKISFNIFGRLNNMKLMRNFKPIIISLTAAILFSFLTYYVRQSLFNFLNTLSWIALAFYLYRDLFHIVNGLDMADDLKLWLLRIAGAIVAIFGLFLGLTMCFASSLANSDPIANGISILLIGLGILGLFMIFRTKRRYGHLYVNR